MGNSTKGTAVEEKLVFSGNIKDFEHFRTVMHRNLEEKDQEWFSLEGQGIVKTYHNTVVERTTRNSTTPMQTDLNKFSSKKIANVEETIKQNGTPVTLDLSLVKNKKDVIGSVWGEHDKIKTTETQMKTWHESIDQSYLVKCNHSVLKILHNAIYPTVKVNTKTNQRIEDIVDTTEIRKILSGENNGVEGI